MEDTIIKRVEQVLDTLDSAVLKEKSLEKAERLNEQYKEIKPDPFHYSIEQAVGLPAQDKYDS